MLRTRLTELLGITHPVLLAGMSSASGVDLVVAVSEAGGLGVLGASGLSPERLREEIAEIRARTGHPFGVNLLQVSADRERRWQQIRTALDEQVPVLSTAWARPDEVAEIARAARAAGVLLMHMVQSAAQAAEAARAGASIVIAQGHEGGGHVGSVATMPVVPAAVDAVTRMLPEDQRPPIVASGGIADGRGLAAALALGADGVSMGTRFLATPEANVHAQAKAAICAANEADTEWNTIRDIVAGQDFLEAGAYCRAIRNPELEKWLGREAELRAMDATARAEIRAQWDQARQEGRMDQTLILAGQDCGLIHDVLPAGEVVRQTVADAEAILRRLQRQLS